MALFRCAQYPYLLVLDPRDPGRELARFRDGYFQTDDPFTIAELAKRAHVSAWTCQTAGILDITVTAKSIAVAASLRASARVGSCTGRILWLTIAMASGSGSDI
jgi:hypothetical protein